MSVIPDFTTVDLDLAAESAAGASSDHVSTTPEGIDIPAVTTADDIADLD